jgi:hypothetical protein
MDLRRLARCDLLSGFNTSASIFWPIFVAKRRRFLPASVVRRWNTRVPGKPPEIVFGMKATENGMSIGSLRPQRPRVLV